MIVDLAVADDPNCLILVGDRLVACRQIDDRQAAHTEHNAVGGENALVVGPAVHYHLVHTAYRLDGVAPCTSIEGQPNDATHVKRTSSGKILDQPRSEPVSY